MFYSDPDKIKNVLFYLISNSIKFTYQGHINVNIAVKLEDTFNSEKD